MNFLLGLLQFFASSIWGLLRSNRLTFGVKPAPKIFQNIIDNLLRSQIGVLSYIDDIIIAGETENEVWSRTKEVVKRLTEVGFRLNLDKSIFCTKELSFLGVILNQEGRRPDPNKVKDLQGLRRPETLLELQSFLGIINFFCPFVQNLHVSKQPFRKLLKKDSKFIWSDDCQQSFDLLKKQVAECASLAHFDPKKKTIIAADASSEGIGASLLQEESPGKFLPINFISKALTDCQKNYAQIEKEGFALVYAVNKFHKYVYGRKFTLETDHQPLLHIFKPDKGIKSTTAKRLQRWALFLNDYDFEIKYINTLSFGYADCLSRLFQPNNQPEDKVIAGISINEQILDSPLLPQKISLQTQEDDLLKSVIICINNSWSSLPKIKTNEFDLFFNRKNNLKVLQGCIMMNERVVIPKPLRARVLDELHYGHPGSTRMKSQARLNTY